jgi:hypothetical protein
MTGIHGHAYVKRDMKYGWPQLFMKLELPDIYVHDGCFMRVGLINKFRCFLVIIRLNVLTTCDEL